MPEHKSFIFVNTYNEVGIENSFLFKRKALLSSEVTCISRYSPKHFWFISLLNIFGRIKAITVGFDFLSLVIFCMNFLARVLRSPYGGFPIITKIFLSC